MNFESEKTSVKTKAKYQFVQINVAYSDRKNNEHLVSAKK